MLIPGISAEFEQEIDPNYGTFDDAPPDEIELDWCPPIVLELLKVSFSLTQYFSSKMLPALLSWSNLIQ